jgi:hypothetical protein
MRKREESGGAAVGHTHFNAEIAPVDIVPKEEIAVIRGFAANFERLHEIVEQQLEALRRGRVSCSLLMLWPHRAEQCGCNGAAARHGAVEESSPTAMWGGGTADFRGRRIGKRKEKKLTVEAGQPGAQTCAGFPTCMIHQNPVKINKVTVCHVVKKERCGSR